MATSIALIVLLGLVSYKLFSWMRLPGFLGVLLLGIAIGPNGTDWIDESILLVSGDLRKIALIIILLRAGLGLHRQTLKQVGMPALRLGFIPVIIEGFVILLAAVILLDMSGVEAGMLGFIIAAVSPAVIVPKMLQFIHTGKGADKGIPTMILAGASIDDVVAITIFSAFAGMYAGSSVSMIGQILSIPIAIITGAALGIVIALLLLYIFQKVNVRHTKKILIIIAASILMTTIEDLLKNHLPLAALLGVMAIGFVIYERKPQLGITLSGKFAKIWVFAEILLFFLVGAEVNFLLAAEAGLVGLVIIGIGLLGRSLGVILSLTGTNLTLKEKGFCIMAYSPKATVQAAIGSVPLAMGVPAGDIILTIAVLSIVITAPLGSIAMNIMGNTFLRGKSLDSARNDQGLL